MRDWSSPLPSVDSRTLESALWALGELEARTDLPAADTAALAREVQDMLGYVDGALARMREDVAHAMYQRGMSLAAIGETLGFSRQRAHQLVGRARRRDMPERLIPADSGMGARHDYDVYLHSLYVAAEEATRGVLVSRRHEGNVDPRRFYWLNGRPPMYAASEELLTYWDEEKTPGTRRPLSYAQWQAQSREVAA